MPLKKKQLMNHW